MQLYRNTTWLLEDTAGNNRRISAYILKEHLFMYTITSYFGTVDSGPVWTNRFQHIYEVLSTIWVTVSVRTYYQTTMADSDYESIRNNCLENGKLWDDPQFTAAASSIHPDFSAPEDWLWKRPKVWYWYSSGTSTLKPNQRNSPMFLTITRVPLKNHI